TVQKVAGSATRLSHRYLLRTRQYTITATVTYQDGTWTTNAARVTMAFRDPKMAYVADTFFALTGVAIDAVRLRQWTHVVEGAADSASMQRARSVVVGLMRMSAESRARLVRALSRKVLHRNPTRSELGRALSLFPTTPLLASVFGDGGWARVKPVVLM